MSMTPTPEQIAAGVQALWSASGGDMSATADEMHAVFYAMQEAAPAAPQRNTDLWVSVRALRDRVDPSKSGQMTPYAYREQQNDDDVRLSLREATAPQQSAAPTPQPGGQAAVAYLYHDAASAETANPMLHSTLLVMAADRRPHCRNETPLYTRPAQPEALVPLNDEQIDGAIRVYIDVLLDHIDEYGTISEGVVRRFRMLARAIERAHGIGGKS